MQKPPVKRLSVYTCEYMPQAWLSLHHILLARMIDQRNGVWPKLCQWVVLPPAPPPTPPPEITNRGGGKLFLVGYALEGWCKLGAFWGPLSGPLVRRRMSVEGEIKLKTGWGGDWTCKEGPNSTVWASGIPEASSSVLPETRLPFCAYRSWAWIFFHLNQET